MQVINVIKDFVLTLADGTKREFKRGIQEVEDIIAGHWFVKAHSEPVNAKASEEGTDPASNATLDKTKPKPKPAPKGK